MTFSSAVRSAFDQITDDMNLTKVTTEKGNDAKGGNFDTFFTVADAVLDSPANNTTTINRFNTVNTIEENDEVIVKGDDDSGFDFSTQNIKVETEAVFDPQEMLGLDGTYIANIRKANAYRASAASLVQEGSDRNTTLTATGGDPDYLRSSEIAFQDRLDAGENISTTEYIKAVGQFDGSRINPDGNEAAKAADENAVYNYEMSKEEERVHRVYENVTVENYTQTILGNSVKDLNQKQTVNQQLNSTKEDTNKRAEGLRFETPEARVATTLSDNDYNAIINSILK
jgi:hypothetical protein